MTHCLVGQSLIVFGILSFTLQVLAQDESRGNTPNKAKVTGCFHALPPYPQGEPKAFGFLKDESVIVGNPELGLKNAVIWLTPKGNNALHPSEDRVVATKPLRLTNDRLDSRITIIEKGDSLELTNDWPKDVIATVSVFTTTGKEHGKSLLKGGSSGIFRFNALSRFPYEIIVSVEDPTRKVSYLDRMGYVLTSPTPYYAISGSDGTFTVDNIPYGDYEMNIWHERYRFDNSAVLKYKSRKISIEATPIKLEDESVDLGILEFNIKK